MLRIDLRALERGPVETAGALASDDPLFEGLDFTLGEPVRVSGELAVAGPDQYFWRGELQTRVRGECRRCLAPVEASVAAPLGVLFTTDPQTDDPSAWVIAPRAMELDLRPTIREELILSAPAYLLCRDDCRGLCPGCGQDLNQGSCTCPPSRDPRWGPLEAARDTLPGDTR
jgi:uncharacterized protein